MSDLKAKIKARLSQDPYLPPEGVDYWEWFDKCPECDEPSEGSCKCMRADSSCKNGHSWHNCTQHQVKVPGHSDHSIATNICTCGKDPHHTNLRIDIFK